MKQLLFCEKTFSGELSVRYTIMTDVFVPVQDIVSPQKTTLILPKTEKIELYDIIIIRDNNSAKIEYIGYIDTLKNKENTEISCYPLINVFDNDYVLDQIYESVKQEQRDENGEIVKDEKGETVYKTVDAPVDVAQWIIKQLNRAFIETDDKLQALPLIIQNKTKAPVFYKKVLDTSNLFEVYVDLFINSGLYIEFSGIEYNFNKISGIYCNICCNKTEKVYNLRYDNPTIQSVDIIDNTFTNYNKIIATEELSEEDLKNGKTPKRYYFYLLDDNSITTFPNDERRIKQVRSKEITFSLEENKSDEENAKALLLYIHNELQAPEYNLQITIDMFNNDNIKLYKRVDFLAENGIIYSSNITKVERLNDLQVRVTLGALRNSLTDFKKKVEAI